MKVAVIGGGTMGEAIIKSILRKRLAAKADISVCDVIPRRRDYFKSKYGLKAVSDNAAVARAADVIILAVKPQDMVATMEGIAGSLKSQLVISIAAGVTLDTLCGKLNYRKVVRAMPNTPAQVGRGMTAWTAAGQVGEKEQATARAILLAMGEEQFFADEKYIDMATAISGSGPAYVFLFIEALIDAGVHIGLPRDMARKLVVETIAGSAEAMKKTAKHPAELRNMVTSPGGTTAEALYKLEVGGMRSLLISAAEAAYNKAKALGAK